MEDLAAEEFAKILADEVATLEEDVRPVYERFAGDVERVQFTWTFQDTPVQKPVWVVARAGARVLGYDEVEEEYGMGDIDPTGELKDWGTWGRRLRYCLLRFPNPRAYSPPAAPDRPSR